MLSKRFIDAAQEALVLTLERQGMHRVADASLDAVIAATVQHGLGGALCTSLCKPHDYVTIYMGCGL